MNNIIGIIVTPMERGQITIPKKYREKLGITPGMPLSVVLRADELVVKPVVNLVEKRQKTGQYVIKAKYGRKDYLDILRRFETGKSILWNEEDDIAREAMRKKEKFYDF